MTDQPDWTEQAQRLMAGLSGMFAGQAPSGATGEAAASGDCRWCPLCQAAAVLRGERPEVTAALADILTTASAALRSFAAQGASATGAAADVADAENEPAQSTAAPDDPDVQRIEIA